MGYREENGISFTTGQGTFHHFGKEKINQAVFEAVQKVEEPAKLKTLKNEVGF